MCRCACIKYAGELKQSVGAYTIQMYGTGLSECFVMCISMNLCHLNVTDLND